MLIYVKNTLLILNIFIALLAIQAPAFSQVHVEDYRGKTVNWNGQSIKPTDDDDLFDYCIELAMDQTRDGRGNPAYNATVYFGERRYVFDRPQKKIPAWLWCCSEGQGRRSTSFIFRGVEDNNMLLLSHGHGGGIRGIRVAINSRPKPSNVTAFHLESCSSYTMEQCETDLLSTARNSNGIVIAKKAGVNLNTESLVIRDINVRANNPFWLLSGDNVRIQNIDAAGFGGHAVFQGAGMSNCVIEQVAAHGGKHLIDIQRRSWVGAGMTLRDIRYEQTEAKPSDNSAAIRVYAYRDSGLRHGMEYLLIEGCRITPNRFARMVETIGVLKVDVVGGWLPGPRVVLPYPEPTTNSTTATTITL